MRSNLFGSLYLRQLGSQLTIPRGRGNKVKSSRWQTPVKITNGKMDLSGSITAVGTVGTNQASAGATVSLFGLCSQEITGSVCAWAGGRGYTDRTVIQSMANFTEGALESLTRELSFRIDRYIRTTISGSAFTAYAVSVAGVKPTANKVPTANALVGKNVGRIAPLLEASGCPRWDDGTFVGVAHPLSRYDMLTDISASGFISTARYNDARMIYRGEIGEFYGVRWLMSNGSAPRIYGATTTTATFGVSASATGAEAFIFAPDAFYNIELDSAGVEVIHQPLGSGGATGDPAAQVGGISVKVHFGVLPTPSGDKRVMRFVHGTPLGF